MLVSVYIYDYLVKRDLKATAQAFQAKGKVSSDPVAIDAPGGFLFEWWSVFWDIFIARTNEKHSDVASSYIEAALRLAQLDRVAWRLSRHVMEHHEVMVHTRIQEVVKVQRKMEMASFMGVHLIRQSLMIMGLILMANTADINALPVLYHHPVVNVSSEVSFDVNQDFVENFGSHLGAGKAGNGGKAGNDAMKRGGATGSGSVGGIGNVVA
ncbi:hypothetical protein RIF29_17459 [Crotalaria pallida]|uniref:LisH domain-containing protein n=1 Tax=Crotalaria pallida TaxID=3830 RepID=A0AAN9FI60_CROPI